LQFVDHLQELTEDVDVILCDIWGVIHDGLTSFGDACAALRSFRKGGGTVVLITNAPRPADSVRHQLLRLNVADDVYDAIVSSGDLTRNYVKAHLHQSVFQIGPSRDAPMFKGLDVAFAPLEEADYIVCTGLFDDETETADDYQPMMEAARARDLTLICANPDIVVERGNQLIPCAGAIAELYRELGGTVIFYGKPHRPAYERAIALAEEKRGAAISPRRMLAIGDSVRTDLAGAHAMKIDCLFVTRGIHAGDFDGVHEIDDNVAKRLFGNVAPPRALTRGLRW